MSNSKIIASLITVAIIALVAMALALAIPEAVAVAPIPTCAQIKGNITLAGERIYHLKDSPYFTQTVINPARGEKYFCSEQDAINAGFRKALAP